MYIQALGRLRATDRRGRASERSSLTNGSAVRYGYAKRSLQADEACFSRRQCFDRDFRLGRKVIEVYLSESGMGWVLRVAALLKDLYYSAFVRTYQPVGRRALHPRVMLGLVVYGIINRQ